ncbi:low molecular weight protein-tyrosine-phosphatase [Idiomarina aminovorans]|uniref:low molecular weight protein-tyrosine-phosphatase n=1 Tax=Idiomarina aminovorans TaxID=2914829 RepID=UPI0020040DED|nr:low molecular weight protein-tyrosine-phosphatase [Idiomarina sp. ATCH4]MCK7458404.1 low molecular weight phosphotyrosine protein phosphatase [Idiomarina sp. ATCH4]
MKKILMVCLGNICRSPAAEGFFQSFIDNENLALQVDSAATSNYHIGEQPDKRMQKSMRARGIDISHLRGRQVTKEDFEQFDFVYAMDRSNFHNLKALAERDAPGYEHKVELFLQTLHSQNSDEPLEVPDPYFGGPEGFERCVDLIERGAKALIKQQGES